MARYQDADEHNDDGDERERPHRVLPSHARWDDDRQDAAGEGSAAAIAINADLVEEDVRNALQSTTRSGHAAAASTKRNERISHDRHH